jgi:hypothetical protein
VSLECGRIYIIFSPYTKPPKEKICLCVCDVKPLFFFINTKPSFIAGASVQIDPSDSASLTHVSHVDLSNVVTFQPTEIAAAQARDLLSEPATLRIIAALQVGIKTLPPAQANRAIETLTDRIPPF